MIVEISGLHKQYKQRINNGFILNLLKPKHQFFNAVNGIDLSIGKGEFVGVLGQNGAGKSTFIKLLCGLQKPTTGHVKLFGKESTSYSKSLFNEVAVIFGQKSSLWWDLPLIDSINAAQFMYNIDADEFELRKKYIVDALGLEQVLDRPVRVLSLGERVKGELAFNLMHKPKLILLDEPTIGLDIVSKSKLRNFLKELVESERVTVILTSHDMGDIEYCCNRICVIEQGGLKFDGCINEFKSHICLESIMTLSFNNNVLEQGKLKSLNQIEGVNSVVWCDNEFTSHISFQPTLLSSSDLVEKINGLQLSVDGFSIFERQASFEEAVLANFEGK